MSPTSMLASLLAGGAVQPLSLEQLEMWGSVLGAVVLATRATPRVITLAGDLGAGKTTLARAICHGLSVANLDAVTSPTFAILQHYDAPFGPIAHADLYRLKNQAELDALGWDEIVATSLVLLVEWPDRAALPWPVGTINVTLSHNPEDSESRLLQATLT